MSLLERYEEAAFSNEKAIILEPSNSDFLFNQGIILAKLSRYGAALECYERGLRIQPDNHRAWFNKGMALGHLGKDEEAILCFKKCINIDTNYYYAWLRMGQALQFLERYQEAFDSFDHLSMLCPDYQQACLERSKALQKLERFDEAVQSNNIAIAIMNKDLYKLGEFLFTLERYDSALLFMNELLKTQPSNCDAWYYKISSLCYLGRREEAETSLQRSQAIGCLVTRIDP